MLTLLEHERFSADALGIVFAFVKLFKYFQVSPRLRVIAQTLQASYPFVAAWAYFFAGIAVAFTMLASRVYGRYMPEFSNLVMSLRMMVRMMLGRVPYADMYSKFPWFTPVFCVVFFALVNYLMVNLLVAIIHYQYVFAQQEQERAESHMTKVERSRQQKAKEDGVRLVLHVLCPFLQYMAVKNKSDAYGGGAEKIAKKKKKKKRRMMIDDD